MLRKIESLKKKPQPVAKATRKKIRQKIYFPSQTLSHSKAEYLLALLSKFYLTFIQSFPETVEELRIHRTQASVKAGGWATH